MNFVVKESPRDFPKSMRYQLLESRLEASENGEVIEVLVPNGAPTEYFPTAEEANSRRRALLAASTEPFVGIGAILYVTDDDVAEWLHESGRLVGIENYEAWFAEQSLFDRASFRIEFAQAKAQEAWSRDRYWCGNCGCVADKDDSFHRDGLCRIAARKAATPVADSSYRVRNLAVAIEALHGELRRQDATGDPVVRLRIYRMRQALSALLGDDGGEQYWREQVELMRDCDADAPQGPRKIVLDPASFGFGEIEPGARKSTMQIGGAEFHAWAFEVRDRGDSVIAVNPAFEKDLALVMSLLGRPRPETVEIDGREHVIVAYPFGQ